MTVIVQTENRIRHLILVPDSECARNNKITWSFIVIGILLMLIGLIWLFISNNSLSMLPTMGGAMIAGIPIIFEGCMDRRLADKHGWDGVTSFDIKNERHYREG
jgi:uncharacterized membrane protein HdeD (DUF308 family)